MNVKEAIDRINDHVVEITETYLELKKEGTNYKACCPFHNEKTPSLVISPAKGKFKCFGCGEGGDAIEFIKKHEGVDFPEALKIGAKKLNFVFEFDKKENDFNDAEYKRRESFHLMMAKVSEFFEGELKKSAAAQKYIATRDFETGNDFSIGFAPAGNKLLEFADANGIKRNSLLEMGLIKENDDKNGFYDFFRNRIMFPISNPRGKIVGFTGRSLTDDKKIAKYLNSPETELFHKGNELFALNIARGAIKREDLAYLVEGNFDTMRMHKIGVTNVVAPCGTALTLEQAKLLKTYTNKVTLIYDGDDAGHKAIIKNSEILIKEQFYVSVIALPDGEDPDTCFNTIERFEEFKSKFRDDAIVYQVKKNQEQAKDPIFKSDLIKRIAKLVTCYDDVSKHDVYIESLQQYIKPRKAWQDAISQIAKETQPEKKERKSNIPQGITLEEVSEWGFYSDNNCYYFRDKKGENWVPKSNFIMRPLFHIESTMNAKRLYEVVNYKNVVKVFEIQQKDLVSISAFKVQIESLGDFLWTGGDAELNKLKSWLYAKTETCKEIVQMGWQKEGFFCWGNGIFNDEFKPADKYGIVQHKERYFYIPSCSKIYDGEGSLFEFERSFVHYESDISMRDYFRKFIAVFGDNGKVAIAFYLAALFLDIINKTFQQFPLLNLFGPKGAGKNACAEALLHLFGHKQKMPNLHNTSKAALADHVATTANAICVLDEYRNDLEMEKRELLKGFWDKTGRTRMNMDKDKKKETSRVDQAVIICGQQMATADIALFSRFMVLSFTQTVYSEEEKNLFKELEKINQSGLTHITHQILKHRPYFENNYKKYVDKVNDEFRKRIKNATIETRTYNNWLTVIAAYATLQEQLELPWSFEGMMDLCVKFMIEQNKETGRNDDLGKFWKTFQYLISSNQLHQDGDYKVIYATEATRRYMENGAWLKEEVKWKETKQLFYMSTSRVFSLYKTQCLHEGDKPLPESTIEYYLRNCDPFLFETKKESFKKIDPKTGYHEKEDSSEKKKYTSTSALVFDFTKLNLSLNTDKETSENDGIPVIKPEELTNEQPAITIEQPPF